MFIFERFTHVRKKWTNKCYIFNTRTVVFLYQCRLLYVQPVDGAGHSELRRNRVKADVVTANRATEVVAHALRRKDLLPCTRTTYDARFIFYLFEAPRLMVF